MNSHYYTFKEIKKLVPGVLEKKREKSTVGRCLSRTFIFLPCPIKSYNCFAVKPRWVLLTNVLRRSKKKGKYLGLCTSCRRYKGGYINKNGYHVTSCNSYPILTHRLVMQKILGRKLRKGETVHHKNGKRADNRPQNLELRMSGNHPKGWSLRQMREYLKTVPKRLGGLK